MMKTLLIGLVRMYQLFVSIPLHYICGPFSGCRFHPTCSQYFIDAVRVHGSVRGAWMGSKRICRCHPWGGQGYDPVPDWEKFVSANPSSLKEHESTVGRTK